MLSDATAILDAVEVEGGRVVVHAHLRVPGTRLDERPAERVRLRIGQVLVDADWDERPDRHARYGAWSGLRAVVDLAGWPRGSHGLRVVLTGAEPVLRASRSLFRTARCGAHDEVALGVRAGPARAAVVELLDGGESAARRLAWRSDLRAVRHRQPLWGWRLVRRATWWMHRRPLWLVGERRDTAQDNGAALFAYLRRERPDLRAYYVVARGSAGWARMHPLGRVVADGSLRHRLLVWHASHLVNAFDPDAYGIPAGWRRDTYIEHVRPRVGTRRVFLQHGVVYRDLTSVVGRLVAGYDLVLTSAERERAWLAERHGYGDRAVLTGLPRHDLLRREPDGLRVLFAPTWRSDLVVPSYREGGVGADPADVADSDYVRFVRAVIGDPLLLAALERLDATLEVLPHYEAASVLAGVVADHPRVRLVDQAREEFGQVLRRASAFLTDYSSTIFDAALLGLPVVAAHVDPDFERAGSPQAFDLRDLGMGPVTDDVGGAVAAVVAYLEAGGVREPARDTAVAEFFAFHDTGNAARAVAAIEAMD